MKIIVEDLGEFRRVTYEIENEYDCQLFLILTGASEVSVPRIVTDEIGWPVKDPQL